jgi:dihydrofolate synthase / folylpolyglutamate synthase
MARLERSLTRLYGRVAFGVKLGLDPLRAACARAGNPQNRVPYVHIAGTNGKGSVAALLESTARAAGRRTGLFTSPHLCRFAERIQIGGTVIADDALADVLERALDFGPDLTFFEVTTLAAFIAFAEANCDYGVLEVGLGGRLDATNVVDSPSACAITSIDFDHTQHLGPTLELIAREKAGILKPGVAFVCGDLAAEPKRAIDAVAAAVGAVEQPRLREDDAHACNYARQMPGLHGTSNAAVAASLARLSGVAAGIQPGFASATWPGRMELIEAKDGLYLLDGAHNAQGTLRLASHLQRSRAEAASAVLDAAAPLATALRKPATLVFGVFADKDWRTMIDILAPHFTAYIYTCPEGRDAAAPLEIATRFAGTIAPHAAAALQAARTAAGPHGLVAVVGSLHLVGACRALLLDLPRDPPVAM